MRARRNVVAGAIAVLTLVACGSSSKPSSASTAGGSSSTTRGSTAPSSGASGGSTTTATSAASGKPLPAPCSLVTKNDVSSLFGTLSLDATPSTGPAPGVAQCAFSLGVGSQGLSVIVKTHTDYASDRSFVFPQQGKSVAGIGDLAILTSAQTTVRDLTVKLGKNAIEILVEFYTKPADDAFVTQLAQKAVARA